MEHSCVCASVVDSGLGPPAAAEGAAPSVSAMSPAGLPLNNWLCSFCQFLDQFGGHTPADDAAGASESFSPDGLHPPSDLRQSLLQWVELLLQRRSREV